MPQSTVTTTAAPVAAICRRAAPFETVTFFQPVRNIEIDVLALPSIAVTCDKNGRAGYSVHVVIAVNADSASLLHGLSQSIHRFGHPRHQLRRVQRRERHFQELPSLPGSTRPRLRSNCAVIGAIRSEVASLSIAAGLCGRRCHTLQLPC